MTEEELNALADTVALYYKALVKRNIPTILAEQIVRDWQSACVQDELDRRHGARNSPSARSFRTIMATHEPRDE